MKRRGKLRERIIRILLNEPDGTLTEYRVAKEAECSFSWVHELLGKLETMGLVDGTRVRDYEGLVGYWRKVKTKSDKKEYMHRNPLSLLKRTSCNMPLQLIRPKPWFNIIFSLHA